ncbi:MAG TPA: beta-ketoacyl synthase N-terminal-like domain-containing protein [Candidatus Binatus sp.]|nr:beta-ketoacyl synthase N-terminal-like domain-containing protein [Candidatus Binatus sp.]
MSAPVAITGAAAVTPAGEVPLDALPDAVQGRALRGERMTQLALAAAGPALSAAGLAVCEGPPRPEVGVVLGTAFGCFLTNVEYQRRLAEGGIGAASPRLFAATVSNAAAGELAIAYRLGGPSVTVSAGAASGLVALGHAAELVRAGRVRAIVAGGLDALGDAVLEWMRDGGLDPGVPATEAAAVLVLETAGSARARGASILGTIEGHAAGFEPRGGESQGLAAAVARALGDAGVPPADIELVVSGAGPGAARAEDEALRAALGGLAPRRIRPKLARGEAFGAAGPLGLLAAFAEAARGAAVLVTDVCASGHVAALVGRVGDGA